jgi:hypothetical protein
MKCHRNGCHSAAAYHVGLEVTCIGSLAANVRPRMIQAPSTVKVCVAHMEDAAKMILSPANKAQIAAGLASEGIPMPDFSSAEVVFVPIGAAENNFHAAREAGTRH